jgi:hypothetical protein
MATLAERLADLEPKIGLLRRANEERSALQALRARGTQVAAARAALAEQFEILARVERLGGKVVSRPRVSASLRDKPSALSVRLETNTAEAAVDSQWVPSFLSPLGTFSEKLKAVVLEAWQALVDRHVQPVSDDVLGQFERIGLDARVREVRSARDRIKELRSRAPASDSALASIVTLADTMANELGALEAVPPSVRAFIAKATKHDACLEDLTNEVQAWLRGNDLLKSIRIGFK